jgi:hypothetical protein
MSVMAHLSQSRITPIIPATDQNRKRLDACIQCQENAAFVSSPFTGWAKSDIVIKAKEKKVKKDSSRTRHERALMDTLDAPVCLCLGLLFF